MTSANTAIPALDDEAMAAARTLHSTLAKPVGSLGALEQWDGKMGIGPLNAEFAMNRAVELSKDHGIGCVGLSNTNHWMRAGPYGLLAATTCRRRPGTMKTANSPRIRMPS